ncbi:sporulation protein YqfC [Clostridium cellulovorans]|uniref:YabP family protein n=1 Tax=Clostridium cellulovorans (strain ATCC 35296 / DSM 3052 / OCM 3 / 743B) TaxID=573061 RepID=D9SW53_CLOC7|nr:sporulation protein YqfC [Clostridium cellulovorans]ADL51197.1 YabP family protein [Clostridium cellulovorans 743B]
MKNKLLKITRNVTETLDIPKEVVLGLPKISIIGHEEALIENHKGILSFKENSLVIKSQVGNITIKGKKLEMSYITDNTIIIKGVIEELYIGGKHDE